MEKNNSFYFDISLAIIIFSVTLLNLQILTVSAIVETDVKKYNSSSVEFSDSTFKQKEVEFNDSTYQQNYNKEKLIKEKVITDKINNTTANKNNSDKIQVKDSLEKNKIDIIQVDDTNANIIVLPSQEINLEAKVNEVTDKSIFYPPESENKLNAGSKTEDKVIKTADMTLSSKSAKFDEMISKEKTETMFQKFSYENDDNIVINKGDTVNSKDEEKDDKDEDEDNGREEDGDTVNSKDEEKVDKDEANKSQKLNEQSNSSNNGYEIVKKEMITGDILENENSKLISQISFIESR